MDVGGGGVVSYVKIGGGGAVPHAEIAGADVVPYAAVGGAAILPHSNIGGGGTTDDWYGGSPVPMPGMGPELSVQYVEVVPGVVPDGAPEIEIPELKPGGVGSCADEA